MRNKMKAIIIIGLAAATYLTIPSSSAAQDSLEFAKAVPPGALVYVEVRDFGGRLQQFLQMEFAKKFPETRAFKDFTATKLYNKLGDRIAELEQATGFGLSLERASELAGGRSAIALYDIGELQFIFLSRMPFEKAAATALWDLRSQFEERLVDGVGYYFKEDPDGRTALMFAIVGDVLVAGTDLLSFEASLKLLNEGGDSLASDERFASAFPVDFALQDAVLYLDQERIAETPHFRSYWIYGNQADLREINRAVICLGFGEDAISETRWFTTAKESGSPAMNSAQAVAGALPGGREIYYLSSLAGGEFASFLARELYEDAGESFASDLGVALKAALPVEFGLAAGATFDEDEFFINVDKTFAIQLEAPRSLDRRKLERALAGYFEAKLLAKGQAEFKFIDRSGLRVLDIPLFEESAPGYRLDGPILLVTNDASAFSEERAGGDSGRFAAPEENRGLQSVLKIDAGGATERLASYFKIVTQRNNWRSGSNASFFWRNVVSLFESLEFLKTLQLVRSREGGFDKEVVVYSFR
ncbi:MAG TPA: hypothetical protein VMX35_09520 [Acidobacteriota bacterium]|nr:hypothetical protein [Acidobacteriota bacterium]